MEKAYKYRIYPNKKQKEQLAKTFGCCRFAYNHYLAMRIEKYESDKITFNYYDCANDLKNLKKEYDWLKEVDSTALQSSLMKNLKKEYDWLKEVDSTALQSSLRDLDVAYQKFFKEHSGYPKFKSRKTHRFSYKSKCVNGNIDYCNKHIKLPKLGMVKTKNKFVPQGRILNATVSQDPSGKYYVSLCCADVEITQLPETNQSIGLDLGIKKFVITSNGEMIENPKYLRKSMDKLVWLQRELSRKTTETIYKTY